MVDAFRAFSCRCSLAHHSAGPAVGAFQARGPHHHGVHHRVSSRQPYHPLSPTEGHPPRPALNGEVYERNFFRLLLPLTTRMRPKRRCCYPPPKHLRPRHPYDLAAILLAYGHRRTPLLRPASQAKHLVMSGVPSGPVVGKGESGVLAFRRQAVM